MVKEDTSPTSETLKQKLARLEKENEEKTKEEKKREEAIEASMKDMASKLGIDDKKEEPKPVVIAEPTPEPPTPDSKTDTTPEQKAVTEAREKYANELGKYKKEAGIWNKMKHHLTPEKKHAYINEKYPNVAVLKEAYDKARIELGNKMYTEKKAELEKTITDPVKLKEALDKYKETEVKLALHYGEAIGKNEARIEKLPSRRRELLNKAMEATSGVTKKGAALGVEGLKKLNETKFMKVYKKIGDFGSASTKIGKINTKHEWWNKAVNKVGNEWGNKFVHKLHKNFGGYELTLGKLVRSASLGAVFGIGGAAHYGIKLFRGTVIATVGGAKLSTMAEKHKQRISDLEAEKATIESALTSASGTEIMIRQEQLEAIEKRIIAENTSYMRNNALIVAAMIGTNIASAKAENAIAGHGDHATGSGVKKNGAENNGGAKANTETKAEETKSNTSDTATAQKDTAVIQKQPVVSQDSSLNQQDSATIKINPNQADSTNINQQDSTVVKINPNQADSTSVNNADTAQQNPTPAPKVPDQTIPKPPAPATSGIPKEALIDAKHNVGITYALKSQLEANSDLAHKLGYDVAPNKAQFLADLGKKLGYINEHGDVRVQADMGAAYVLNPDGSVTEYQNGIKIEGHNMGDNFEGKDMQEKYEYYHENKVPTPNGGKGEFDGPAESISQNGTRVEGGTDEFAGDAENIGNNNLYGGEHHDLRGGHDRNTTNDGFKPLSTNGAAEEMARRGSGTNISENAANSSNVNIESTEQFINTKANILDKDFSRWFTRGSVSKEWIHIQGKSMDEMAKPDYEFASRGEAKGVARLIKDARNAGIDYHGKTADQLVNELAKKELAK